MMCDFSTTRHEEYEVCLEGHVIP
uniref:Uncharacterized protein n=1 Tax=Arundo donax TaxID=35708 RepID=A0A0A9FVF5_ARUDO